MMLKKARLWHFGNAAYVSWINSVMLTASTGPVQKFHCKDTKFDISRGAAEDLPETEVAP